MPIILQQFPTFFQQTTIKTNWRRFSYYESEMMILKEIIEDEIL
jgi:hypothetical protein